jgi:hypothetical protein
MWASSRKLNRKGEEEETKRCNSMYWAGSPGLKMVLGDRKSVVVKREKM